jgi:hypothetical protein
MTMDTYGHLFPRGEDSAELSAATRLLIAQGPFRDVFRPCRPA